LQRWPTASLAHARMLQKLLFVTLPFSFDLLTWLLLLWLLYAFFVDFTVLFRDDLMMATQHLRARTSL
jgi:hypothetical protein